MKIKPYYQNDLIYLYQGDTFEIMKKINTKVDKIITSPPYNIIRPNLTGRGYDLHQDGINNEKYIDWTLKVFKEYDKILNKNGAIFYNMSYGTENTTVMSLTIAEIIKKTNFTLADILVWKKKSATPNNVSSNKMTRIVEFIYVFCRDDEFHTFTSNKKVLKKKETNQNIYENVFNFFTAKNNNESIELNKANFSTDFVQNIIDRYVLKTDLVLDNFSGTGTTLKACIENNIKAIGIEISEAQCNHTVKRIKKGTNLRLQL